MKKTGTWSGTMFPLSKHSENQGSRVQICFPDQPEPSKEILSRIRKEGRGKRQGGG